MVWLLTWKRILHFVHDSLVSKREIRMIKSLWNQWQSVEKNCFINILFMYNFLGIRQIPRGSLQRTPWLWGRGRLEGSKEPNSCQLGSSQRTRNSGTLLASPSLLPSFRCTGDGTQGLGQALYDSAAGPAVFLLSFWENLTKSPWLALALPYTAQSGFELSILLLQLPGLLGSQAWTTRPGPRI